MNTYIFETVAGSLCGAALGDAVAVPYYEKNKLEISKMDIVDEVVQFPYVQRVSSFDLNDYTSVADQMIVCMTSLILNDGLNINDMAKKLRIWNSHGFPELGDGFSMTKDLMTLAVTKEKGYDSNPIGIAKKYWENFSEKLDNGGIIRAVPVSFIYDTENIIENTIKIVNLSHHDKLIESIHVAINLILTSIFRIRRISADSGDIDIDKLINKVLSTTRKLCGSEYGLLAQYSHMDENTLELSKNPNSILKTYGAGILALRMTGGSVKAEFEKIISFIVLQGGDTCSNCAVAGALVGAMVGYKNLPHSWKSNLYNNKYLFKRIIRIIKKSTDYVDTLVDYEMVEALNNAPVLKPVDELESEEIEAFQ